MGEKKERRSKRFKVVLIMIFVFFIIIFSTSLIFESHRQKEEKKVQEWLNWASIAWRYFTPGIGVNPNTGLHYATKDWHYFTDWDLGTYIIAILDAEELGILKEDGDWGSNYRLNKILDFLETRELNKDNLPYWAYSAENGKPDTSRISNPSDAGRLLLSLYKLKISKPELASRIEKIVYERTNFSLFASDLRYWKGTSGFYAYLDAQGFKLWGFDKYEPVSKMLKWINEVSSMPHIDVYGQLLPKGYITTEPFILGVIDLNLNDVFKEYAQRVYRAQEKRYTLTKILTAWSEGAYDDYEGKGTYYLYEWIVADKEKWIVYSPSLERTKITPVIYTKVAFAFHAMYNTNYTSMLVDKLLILVTDEGFIEGMTENGRVLNGKFGNNPLLTDKTNGMIVSAARYAIKHN